MRRRRRRDLNLVLALIIRRGSVLGDVARPVRDLLGISGWAIYEELLVGPTSGSVPGVEGLGPGGILVEETRVVAAVETWPPSGISGGILARRRARDGILRGWHMAVSARVITAKRHGASR